MTRASRARPFWAPAAAVVAGLAVAVPAVTDDGGRGAVSVLLGTALVVGFLGTGIVPLLLVRGLESSTALGLGVLLLNYTTRLAVAVVVLTLVSRSGALEPRWTGLAVIAGALAWTAGQAATALGAPGPGHDRPGHGHPDGAG